MMRTLRDKKTMQVILWMVVVFFVGTLFLAWGMRFKGVGDRDPNVMAKVGDISITNDDFNKLYQSASDRLYGSKNQSPSPDQLRALHDEILDGLIDNAVLKLAAQKLDLSVPDEELMADIQHQPYFQDEKGKFDKDRYFQVLQANQLTPAQYEASERESKLIQKIRMVLTDGVLYPSDELEGFTALLNRDVKANYVRLDPSAYEKGLAYTEEDLKDFYAQNKDSYDHPERVKVRHILLAAQGATAADPEVLQKKLSDFRSQVLSGKAKFSDLAKKYSADQGTKNKGGDLGWVAKGTTVKEFEDQVFKLKKGGITEPFKTQYGYHIAQVTDIEKEYKSTFTEVRSKVLDRYKKEQASSKVLDFSEKLVDLLKQNKGLEEAAKTLGLSTSSSPWFSAKSDIQGIKDSKSAAAELAGLYPTDWKGPLSIGTGEYFFQITEAKNNKPDAAQKEPSLSTAAQGLMEGRQDTWLADFLKDQRKKLDVKILQNG